MVYVCVVALSDDTTKVQDKVTDCGNPVSIGLKG